MSIFSSAATGGFYDSAIHLPEQIPADAVEISVERHQELLHGQSNGQVIDFSPVNGPTLVDPAPYVAPDVTRIGRAQGKKQLIAAGLYDQVKSWVDDPKSDETGRIGFYDEANWVIDDEFVKLAQTKLALTDEELQQLFNEAAKL